MEPTYIQKNGTTPQLMKSGTTTVGITLEDVVILGADKRATMGAFVASKTAEKIQKIDDHIAGTIAGGVADAQYLMDFLRMQAKMYRLKHGRKIPVNVLAKILSNKLYGAKSRGPDAVYQVHHLIGGVDDEGSKLYDIGGYGSILKEDYSSTGSGSVFAFGVLEDGYSRDLDIDQGIELVRKAVQAAISRDIASGNGVDVVIITRDSFTRKFFKAYDQ